MEFPTEIQTIINQYAKPVTRPNWRTLHIMTMDTFVIQVSDGLTKRNILPITLTILYNICIQLIEMNTSHF